MASDIAKAIRNLLEAHLVDAGYEVVIRAESSVGNCISIVVVQGGRKFRVTVSDA